MAALALIALSGAHARAAVHTLVAQTSIVLIAMMLKHIT